MARVNVRVRAQRVQTHEGATAAKITPLAELRRSVMATMLFEDNFYESGYSVADRIKTLVTLIVGQQGVVVGGSAIAQLAIEAREDMKLRHVPLLLARELARQKVNVAALLERIVQRPDELAEFLALYWTDADGKPKKTPLAASVKRGLARAFTKFSEYQLAKYNRDGAVKLRDVLFLVHGKPKDETQAATWKQLVDGTLPTPDTWEVALSAGADKGETFTRLLAERQLGALALLRNLRNMQQAGVSDVAIRLALSTMRTERVLPFRFLSAAKYAPALEDGLEATMFRALGDARKLAGKTALVIDGSGSMFGTPVSAKSEIDRFEAAAALAILLREVCETVNVLVFSTTTEHVPPRRGFALRDALNRAAQRGATNTGEAVRVANLDGYDRIIVVTDEQSHQSVPDPLDGTRAYFVNVAPYQHGIGYGKWTHIDGWSEAIVAYIQAYEAEQDKQDDGTSGVSGELRTQTVDAPVPEITGVPADVPTSDDTQPLKHDTDATTQPETTI